MGGIRIRMKVDGMEGLATVLENLPEAVMPLAAQGMDQGLQEIQAVAKALVPVDTEELKGSIRTKVNQTGDSVEGVVIATAEHAVFVEVGTGPVGAASPHPAAYPGYYSTGEYIFTRVTKDGKSVRFVTDGWVYPLEKGGFRFTRGQKPRPYMYPAYQQKKDAAIQLIAAAIREGLT